MRPKPITGRNNGIIRGKIVFLQFIIIRSLLISTMIPTHLIFHPLVFMHYPILKMIRNTNWIDPNEYGWSHMQFLFNQPIEIEIGRHVDMQLFS